MYIRLWDLYNHELIWTIYCVHEKGTFKNLAEYKTENNFARIHQTNVIVSDTQIT